LDIGKTTGDFSDLEFATKAKKDQSSTYNVFIIYRLPRFEDPPSFPDAVKPIKTHQAQSTDNNINNLTFTHCCFVSGIAFRSWERNLVTNIGLDDEFTIRNQVEGNDGHSLMK
jgi:hypothetical protein